MTDDEIAAVFDREVLKRFANAVVDVIEKVAMQHVDVEFRTFCQMRDARVHVEAFNGDSEDDDPLSDGEGFSEIVDLENGVSRGLMERRLRAAALKIQRDILSRREAIESRLDDGDDRG